MFGRSRRVTFEPYGRRPRRLPRWLMLLLGGIVSGAAAVVFVQERYLPTRLSAGESAQLRAAFARADQERSRLQEELAGAGQRLESALADNRRLGEQLDGVRADNARLRDDLAATIDALPPDPRGGPVEVRAAEFTAKGSTLRYEIVLLREGAGGRPIPGVVRFVVAGETARGAADTVTLNPIGLPIGRHEVVRGSQPLPEGFRPRQATVQVLGRDAGKPLGMRVLRVK